MDHRNTNGIHQAKIQHYQYLLHWMNLLTYLLIYLLTYLLKSVSSLGAWTIHESSPLCIVLSYRCYCSVLSLLLFCPIVVIVLSYRCYCSVLSLLFNSRFSKSSSVRFLRLAARCFWVVLFSCFLWGSMLMLLWWCWLKVFVAHFVCRRNVWWDHWCWSVQQFFSSCYLFVLSLHVISSCYLPHR